MTPREWINAQRKMRDAAEYDWGVVKSGCLAMASSDRAELTAMAKAARDLSAWALEVQEAAERHLGYPVADEDTSYWAGATQGEVA